MQFDATMQTERGINRFQSVNLDFVLVVLACVCLILLIALESWLWFLAPLRLVLAFACVLYIPGYCLSVALFPEKDDLDSTERTGIALGLSVAWISVLALFLDRLPWGLHLWPIILGETVSILIFTAIALRRRFVLFVDRAYTPDFSWRPRLWWTALAPEVQQVYKVAFGALVAVGLSVAWIFLVPAPAEFMTEFYMLGKEGMAEQFPRDAVVGEELQVTLGITNRERSSHTYRVEIWVEDLWQPGISQQVAKAGPLTIARGDNLEWPISWHMPSAGQDQRVDVLLFTENDTEPYRRLLLFLNVRGE